MTGTEEGPASEAADVTPPGLSSVAGEGAASPDFINRVLLEELSEETQVEAVKSLLQTYDSDMGSPGEELTRTSRGHNDNHEDGSSAATKKDWKLDAAEFVPQGTASGFAGDTTASSQGFPCGQLQVADDSPSAVSQAGGSPSRDLINRDLLDELSQEAQEFGEASSPVVTYHGYHTPSDPGSPVRELHNSKYYDRRHHHMAPSEAHSHEEAVPGDQWDWKVDAAEFVPGSMKGMVGGFTGDTTSSHGQPTPTDTARLTQLRAQCDWSLRSKSDEVREMQTRLSQMEAETAQARQAMDMEKKSLVRQIAAYRALLERYCIPMEEIGPSALTSGEEPAPSAPFQTYEQSSASQWLNGTGGGHGQQMDQASGFGGSAPDKSTFDGPSPPGLYDEGEDLFQSNSLDSKMQQLNNLLQAGNAASRRRQTPNRDAGPSGGSPGSGEEAADQSLVSNGLEATESEIASTLRAMFPHATVRTGRDTGTEGSLDQQMEASYENGELPTSTEGQSLMSMITMGDAEALNVEGQVKSLERCTGCMVDERAMRSLLSLSVRDSKEAVGKVDELVQSQGGQCRNLSSILQSVCRKIEKRSKSLFRPEDDHERSHENGWYSRADGAGDGGYSHHASTGVSSSRIARPRRQDEEMKGPEQSMHRGPPPPLSRTSSSKSPSIPPLDTPAGKRSWADMGEEHEQDDAEGGA